MMEYDVKSVAAHFKLDGRLTRSGPFGNGHINDTYSLTCQEDAREILSLYEGITDGW